MSEKKTSKRKLVKEDRSGELYEYYPLGKFVVVAPGVCGGRPTFKYTRLEVSVILSMIADGEPIDRVVQAYSQSQLTQEAVQEAIHLANKALAQSAETILPAVV